MSTPEFTVAHRERMAEELGERVADAASHIGELMGSVRRPTGGYCSRKLSELSDDELHGYAAGQADVFTTIADWIENKFPGCETSEDLKAIESALRHHGCSYDLINAEIEAALGEAMERRHPARGPFPRFRKLNGWLLEIRATRVRVNEAFVPLTDEERAALTGDEIRKEHDRRWAERTARIEALAEAWTNPSPEQGRHWQISHELMRLEYKCRSQEEADARDQVKRELESLYRLCRRVWKAKTDRIRKESDAIFGRVAA